MLLLIRQFWTLNLSSFKQRKGNNIYRLARTWSSYKYSNVAENGRTLKVSLQQRSSKVTWNYTWNLTPLKSPGNLHLTLHFSQHDREFFCLLQYFAWHLAGRLASRPSSLGLLVGNKGRKDRIVPGGSQLTRYNLSVLSLCLKERPK